MVELVAVLAAQRPPWSSLLVRRRRATLVAGWVLWFRLGEKEERSSSEREVARAGGSCEGERKKSIPPNYQNTLSLFVLFIPSRLTRSTASLVHIPKSNPNH